jgi:coenzyme F420-0:L-glutamate ligase/coenzyme F420-1:gamma-L-glutamate ligase
VNLPVILTVWAPDGAPEVAQGDDLAAILVALLGTDGPHALVDGDVVAVTSKVVAKAEGRVWAGTREDAVAAETVRVVARRGPTTIVRTRHGLTMAAAGVDASNVATGHVVLLPVDPDASARAIRRRLADLTGRTVGVVVTDTAGRAWREGQTDIAVGAAGVRVVEDYAGQADSHGNPLVVTAPAVADEIAGAAELAQRKLGRRPFAVVRGRADLVLPAGDDGPGAAALVRPDGADMFGLGSREAVLRALEADPADARVFGRPASANEVADVIAGALLTVATPIGDDLVVIEAGDERTVWAIGVAAYTLGWHVTATRPGHDVDLRPSPPLT